MNSYESRQEAKKERLQAAADKADQRSADAYEASSRAVEHIPMGQPILVGHHSEAGHRRDLAKCHRHMDKSCEEQANASELRRRAASVGKGGISSDDPEAVAKLKHKLKSLEMHRDMIKKVNAAFRKGGFDALKEYMSPAVIDRLRSQMEQHSYIKTPHEDWELTNLGANIRRIKKRIESLEASASEPEQEDITGEGFKIREDKEENRVCIEFDAKPDADTRSRLKSRGFRWNRRLVAWTRHLNNAGRYAAKSAMGITD